MLLLHFFFFLPDSTIRGVGGHGAYNGYLFEFLLWRRREREIGEYQEYIVKNYKLALLVAVLYALCKKTPAGACSR